jgi:hypothetical protein
MINKTTDREHLFIILSHANLKPRDYLYEHGSITEIRTQTGEFYNLIKYIFNHDGFLVDIEVYED